LDESKDGNGDMGGIIKTCCDELMAWALVFWDPTSLENVKTTNMGVDVENLKSDGA